MARETPAKVWMLCAGLGDVGLVVRTMVGWVETVGMMVRLVDGSGRCNDGFSGLMKTKKKQMEGDDDGGSVGDDDTCLLYTSPSPRDS